MLLRSTFLLGIILIVSACAPSQPDPLAVRVEKSDDATVNIDLPDDNTVIYDIISPSGIGNATITNNNRSWPETIVLRFHLNGLENLDFSYTDINIKMEISSRGNNEIRQYVTQDDVTEPIDSTSEFWMPVAISPTEGDATIPLEDGTIDVRVPAAFYDRNAKSFTISWIDFYR